MGDLQRSLGLMLEDDGCDAKLLKDANNKIVVDKTTMKFTPNNQMMLCHSTSVQQNLFFSYPNSFN
jgi:hypothetical protein